MKVRIMHVCHERSFGIMDYSTAKVGDDYYKSNGAVFRAMLVAKSLFQRQGTQPVLFTECENYGILNHMRNFLTQDPAHLSLK